MNHKIDNFVDAEISVFKEISTRSHFKSFGERVCVRVFLGLSSWHNGYMILEDCLFVLLRLFLISWKCSRNLSKSIGLNWGSLSDQLSDLTRGSLIWQKGVWSDKSKERYTIVYIRHLLSYQSKIFNYFSKNTNAWCIHFYRPNQFDHIMIFTKVFWEFDIFDDMANSVWPKHFYETLSNNTKAKWFVILSKRQLYHALIFFGRIKSATSCLRV